MKKVFLEWDSNQQTPEYPKYWDRQAWANNADPDQMTQKLASDHFLHHLSTVQKVVKWIYHMYSDKQTWANSVDADETLHNAASHQDLHCLPLIQQFLDTTLGSKLYLFKYLRTNMVRSWGVWILKVNMVFEFFGPVL